MLKTIIRYIFSRPIITPRGETFVTQYSTKNRRNLLGEGYAQGEANPDGSGGTLDEYHGPGCTNHGDGSGKPDFESYAKDGTFLRAPRGIRYE